VTGFTPAIAGFWYTIVYAAGGCRGAYELDSIMRNAVKTVSGLILVLTMLAGCGQKGPLFLPGDPAAIQTDIPGQYQSIPSPVESDDDDDTEDDDTEDDDN
jgi:predicted small lipoprotein YifL